MLAIIQARMSSSRLPGKMMMKLADRPILSWVYDRVCQAANVDKVLVATSITSSDDPIEAYCSSRSMPIFRGSLEDVAGRFLAAVENEHAPAFIRINGDSPLIDPQIIDIGINQFKSEEYDLVTNVQQRTFPKGQSVEIISTNAFKRLCDKQSLQADREHVTKLFYANNFEFKVKNFSSNPNMSDIQLSVDTMEDFQRVEKIINLSGGLPGGWRELVALEKACR